MTANKSPDAESNKFIKLFNADVLPATRQAGNDLDPHAPISKDATWHCVEKRVRRRLLADLWRQDAFFLVQEGVTNPFYAFVWGNAQAFDFPIRDVSHPLYCKTAADSVYPRCLARQFLCVASERLSGLSGKIHDKGERSRIKAAQSLGNGDHVIKSIHRKHIPHVIPLSRTR